jgi:hypothetical protein
MRPVKGKRAVHYIYKVKRLSSIVGQLWVSVAMSHQLGAPGPITWHHAIIIGQVTTTKDGFSIRYVDEDFKTIGHITFKRKTT